MRWKIEVFHKILKSGCRAEDSKLRTADRLANLMAVFCILSWRVFWLTMLNRTAPNAAPAVALASTEIALLDQLVADAGNRRCRSGTLSFYLAKSSPGSEATWRDQAILRPETQSFGEDFQG